MLGYNADMLKLSSRHARLALSALLALPWLAGQPASAATAMTAQNGVFVQLLDRVKHEASAKHHPVVIFDLDDTLVRTAFRNQAVLKDWTETEAGKPYAAGFATLKLEDIGWGIDGALTKMGVPAELQKDAIKFWVNHFFTSDYLRYDKPNPGAVSYVKAVLAAGGHVVYLSGRNDASMRPGTEASLKACGFPWDPSSRTVTLELKHDKGGSDAEFKRVAAKQVAKLGEVVAVVDNEPANVNAMHESLPGAIAVFLDKPHSPNPPPLDKGVDTAPDFPTP